MNVAPLGSGGELLTGILFVDGEYFAATKTPIEFVWQPDRSRTPSSLQGSGTFERDDRAVQNDVGRREIHCHKHVRSERRKTEIKLAAQRRRNQIRNAVERGAIRPENSTTRALLIGIAVRFCANPFTARLTRLQGASPKRRSKFLPSWLIYSFDLAPNEKRTITFVNSLGERKRCRREAITTRSSTISTPLLKTTTDEWNAELKAAFTPNNGRYLGLSADARHDRRIGQASVSLGGDERALFQAHDAPLGLRHDLCHACCRATGRRRRFSGTSV